MRKKTVFWELLFIAPCAAAVFLVPLWVRLFILETPVALQQISYTPAKIDDFFTVGKQQVLVICTLFAIFCFALAAIKKMIFYPVKNVLWCTALFSGLVLLSAFFAQFPETAWRGIFGRSTGGVTQLCLFVLFLYCACTVVTPLQKKIVLCCFLSSACVIALIAAGQTWGFDILQSDAFRNLIFPVQYQTGEVTFGIFDAYATLSNPNYTAIYCASAFAVAMSCAMQKCTKLRKILFFATAFVLLLGVVAANSFSAYFGLFSAFLLYFILALKRRKAKASTARFIYFICCVALLFMAVTAFLLKPVTVPNVEKEMVATRFLGTETRGNTIWIFTNSGDIAFAKTENGYEAMHSNGTRVPISKDNNIYRFEDSRFANFVAVERDGDLHMVMPEYTLVYTFQDGQYWLNLTNGYLTKAFRPTQMEIFNSLDAYASGRIYIYSRSFPLLFKKPFLGYGPDSFACAFPQGDISGKLRAFNTPFVVIDKPHSVYLQIGLENGLIALAAFLALCASALFVVCKRKAADNSVPTHALYGCVVYLVCGLANDFTIGIAVGFWLLLALCLETPYTHASSSAKKTKK